MIAFTVFGQCFSMKNGRQLGRGKTIEHPKCRKFRWDFVLQVPPEAKQSIGSRKRLLRSKVTVFYPTWKQDLDVAVVYDLLQACGVISNDRWIRYKTEIAVVSKEPRVEIEIDFL